MKKHIWLSLPALALCLLLAFGTSAAAFSDVPAGSWYGPADRKSTRLNSSH